MEIKEKWCLWNLVPMSILFWFFPCCLSVQGKNAHLYVVCGLLQKREIILFIYKVVIVEDSSNSSCLLGYTRAILSNREAFFEIKSTFEKYGI